MAQYPKLKSKFYSFTQDSVELIEDRDVLPPKYRPNVTFKDNGSGSTTRPEQFPDYMRIFSEVRNEIESLESYQHLNSYAIREFETIQKYHSYGDNFEKILLRFLRMVMRNSPSNLKFRKEDFSQVYDAFERDLLSDTITLRRVIPLRGLEAEFEELELNDSTRIREIEEEDIEFMIGEGRGPNSVVDSRPKFIFSDYIFETEIEAEKETDVVWGIQNSGEITKELEDVTEKTLTALRLSSRGTVGYSNIYDQHDAAWYIRRVSKKEARVRYKRAGEKMHIQESLDEFLDMFNILDRKDMDTLDTDLVLAIERFNSSFLRERDSVAFSDLMIVLEALVSKDKNVSGTELAQRTAILLGDSHDERESIFEEVQNLYQQRGRVWGVAHGGGPTGLDDEILEKARKFIRDSLSTILEIERDYGGHGNVLKKMDEEIDRSMLDVEFP